MKFAVTLRFDNVTDQRFDLLRTKVADSASIHDPYPAHITLAAFETEWPLDYIWQCLSAQAEGWSRIPITFSGIGLFPGNRPVVWAVPVVTPLLLETQLRIQSALDGVAMYDHFQSGAWVPHATLVTKISALGRTIETLSQNCCSISGFVERLDLISFPPVHVERSLSLPIAA